MTPKAIITVKRTGGTSGTVKVDYAATGGTATNGADYTLSSATLTIGLNETTKIFTVVILDDGTPAGNKFLNLALSNPGGGLALGTQTTAVLWIVDSQ